jgi:glycosyltransferase 2 family protein
MYALLIAAWRRMLTAWGRGLDIWSAARIWTVSSLGKYLPGKVWAVAGMAVMAQRAGIGAGPATGSAVILQVLAIGTGAAVAGLTGWGTLRAAYPGAATGLAVLLAASVAGIGLLLWPGLLNRLLRIAAPDAGPVTPPAGAVAFGIVANAVAWMGYGVALWLLARGLLPDVELGLLPATAVFTASYLAGFLALFAPGGIGVREGVFILMLQGPIGIGAATALAIASRLLLTVTELGAAVPFLLFPRGRPRVAH